VARLIAILSALGRAVRRDLGTFRSLKTNNFFLFILLMMYGAGESHVEPKSSYPLLLLLSFVLLFPLSSDPLDKVPPSRLALWPLTQRERITLRLISLALSPVLWFAIVLMFFKRVRPGLAAAFLTAAVGVQIVAAVARGVTARAGAFKPFRFVPRFPGRLGELIRNNVRQMLTVLDMYIAILLSLGGFGYRFLAAHPQPEAFPILSLMVALAMSTYAHGLFGLDLASSATTRYRLLPMRGWEILLAKDIAFLGVLTLLVLPLDPLPGLTFGLFALAVGHHASVFRQVRVRRWRFAGTRVFLGVTQAVGGIILGFAEHEHGAAFLLASAAIYAISLWFYGWRWDES
jgi:hypothetical protein